MVDFVIGSLHDLQTAAAYIGSSELEISAQERILMIEAIEKSQARQMAFVGSRVMRMMAIDESNAVYQSFRSKTTMGLEVGSLIAGGYGAVKGVIAFSKLARMPAKIASASRKGLFLSRGAENINTGTNLTKKLSQLETAQQTAVNTRYLRDGRIRYYSAEKPALTTGATRGRAYATEFDLNTGRVRTWMECYDHTGVVNRVHPKQINGQDLISPHYPPTARELGFYE